MSAPGAGIRRTCAAAAAMGGLLAVPAGASGQALQDTIDATPPGTAVRVAPGLYDGPVVLADGRSLVATADETVITARDCEKPAITVPPGSGGGSIEGLTLVSGCPAGSQTGIAVHGPSAPQISDNRIQGFATGIALGLPGDAASATPLITLNAISGTHGSSVVTPGVGIDIGHGANPLVRQNTISSAGPGESIGIRIHAEPAAMESVTGAQLQGDRISDQSVGLEVVDAGGAVTLVNELISRSALTGIRLIRALPQPVEGDGAVRATNVDIVDTAAPNPEIQLAGGSLALDSSIVGNGGIANLSPTGGCTISYSRGPATSPGLGGCGGGDFQVAGDPRFVDAVNGDYQLGRDSPLLDAGNPAPSDQLVDLAGAPRQVDGNGDCEQRRDIGALERRSSNPCLTSSSGRPASAAALPAATAASFGGLEEQLSIASTQKLGNYLLCVYGPGKDQCKTFKAKRHGSRYTDTVTWAKKFRYHGAGQYTAYWHAYRGGPLLGPPQEFLWGSCAPRHMSMDGVWKPNRLIVINRCYTARFVVTRSFRSPDDRDFHVKVSSIGDTPGHFANYEILPRDQHGHLPRPANGRKVETEGVFVCDTFHGPLGHTEIHPVFRQTYLDFDGAPITTYLSGPQYHGTPRVNLKAKGRFHCRGV